MSRAEYFAFTFGPQRGDLRKVSTWSLIKRQRDFLRVACTPKGPHQIKRSDFDNEGAEFKSFSLVANMHLTGVMLGRERKPPLTFGLLWVGVLATLCAKAAAKKASPFANLFAKFQLQNCMCPSNARAQCYKKKSWVAMNAVENAECNTVFSSTDKSHKIRNTAENPRENKSCPTW